MKTGTGYFSESDIRARPDAGVGFGKVACPRFLPLLLLCACAGTPPSAPKPVGVVPSRVAVGTATSIRVNGNDFYADVVTDFGRRANSALNTAFAVSLVAGDGTEVALEGVKLIDKNALTAEVPASVPRGLYDVRVVDPAGRTGTLTGAFRLVTSAESVAAFTFDFIDPQYAGVPFLVGVTAVDEAQENVEGFDGTAQVTAPGAAPVTIGPFARGRARGFVTVAMPAMGVRVFASDSLGNTCQSEPFDVTAGEPARVEFVEAPPRLPAGGCGGPFTLEVRDAFGNPAVAATASAFTAAMNPPESGELFSDAACSAAMTGGMLTARASFFVRATKAGRPQLRVVPAAWPSAVREVDVDAGVAVALVLASAPQVLAAGMCSQPVLVGARDAFGNAAVVADPVPLGVTAEPATGVTLHEDPSCAAPLNVLAIADGGSEARFFFRSAVPAMVELSVDGGALGVARQGVEVTQ